MNRPFNQINMEFIKKMNGILDEIDSMKEEPAVLITIGSGPKAFCSGFDLKEWAENPVNMLVSLMGMQQIFARFLKLGIPSMAVFNGHSIAGGVMLGLCHDRIIMNSDPKFMVCLNELTFGKSFPYSYAKLVRECTSGRLSRTLIIGTKLSSKEALRLDLVQDLYSNTGELDCHIQQFAKERAVIGSHRMNYRASKSHMYRQLLDVLENPEVYNFQTLKDAEDLRQFYSAKM